MPAMPTTSRFGTRGVELVESAFPLGTYDLVLSLGGDYFTGNNLFSAHDADTYYSQRLFVTFAPLEGLELTLGASETRNQDNALATPTAEVSGDPVLGVRYGLHWGTFFAVAAAVRLEIPTSAGGTGLTAKAYTLSGQLLGSWRANRWLALHLNAGYSLDNSSKIYGAQPLQPMQRFAFAISTANQALVGLGAETDFAVSESLRVGPFLEATAGFGIGAKLARDPIQLTLGAKLIPRGAERFELAAGVDLAVAGKPVVNGSQMAGIAPWQIFGRVAVHLGPSAAAGSAVAAVASCAADSDCSAGKVCDAGVCSTVVVKTVVQEAKTPPTYVVRGKVFNKTGNAPIDSAVLKISGYDSTRLAVDPKTGEYASWALACGDGIVQVTATAPGFHDNVQTVAKGADKEVKVVDFGLTSATEVLTGTIRGSLHDSEDGSGVKGEVVFPAINLKLKADSDGRFETTLKPGHYSVLVTAPRYLTQKKEITVNQADVVILNVDLIARHK